MLWTMTSSVSSDTLYYASNSAIFITSMIIGLETLRELCSIGCLENNMLQTNYSLDIDGRELYISRLEANLRSDSLFYASNNAIFITSTIIGVERNSRTVKKCCIGFMFREYVRIWINYSLDIDVLELMTLLETTHQNMIRIMSTVPSIFGSTVLFSWHPRL